MTADQGLPMDSVTSTPSLTRCPRCLTPVALTATGLLAAHGPVVARCPVGGLRPTQARARLDAAARTTPRAGGG